MTTTNLILLSTCTMLITGCSKEVKHTNLPPGFTMGCDEHGHYAPIMEYGTICDNYGHGLFSDKQSAIDRAWVQYEYKCPPEPDYHLKPCD